MKKTLTLALILVMLCCLFCGCETEADKIAAIAGRWETVNYYSSDSVAQSLENLDLYEEEIALLDTGAIGIVDVFEFTTDKTYTMTVDAEESIAMVDAYFRNAFATFYENRDKLASCYTADIVSMTEEEFKQFYVDMYGQTDFDALINMFVYSLTDEEYLLEDTEYGSFRIASGKIFCKALGESEESYITYTVEGDTLTLTFTNKTEVYKRS